MENVELRYAYLTISHLGPEEVFKNGEKRQRIFVAFDVIPITSDGRFTTDRIPPGEYPLRPGHPVFGWIGWLLQDRGKQLAGVLLQAFPCRPLGPRGGINSPGIGDIQIEVIFQLFRQADVV